MSLRIETRRSGISIKLMGTFVAVFALLVQPMISLNIPAAFAATGDSIVTICATGCEYNEATAQNAVDDVVSGGTVNITSDLTITHQITPTKPMTINGNSHMITANFTATDNDNNSVIGVEGANGVIINNLIGNSSKNTNLHVFNLYKSKVALNNVTAENSAANKAGVNVNNAQVTATNITTKNNGYYGIDVDNGTASFTVSGTSAHTETGADIYVDNRAVGQVNDTDNQYQVSNLGNGAVYKLKSSYSVKNESTGNVYSSIQDAIDDPLTVNGNIIDVNPGSYAGNVNVTKTLTIKGAQAGVDARNARGNESVITPTSGGSNSFGFQLNADGITIDGFTVSGSQAGGILSPANHSGQNIVNNKISGNTIGISLNANGLNKTTVSQNLISDNNLAGSSTGSGIYGDAGLSNALIDNNTFVNNTNASVLMAGPSDGLTVSNNISTGTNLGVFFSAKNLAITSNVADSGADSGVYFGSGNDTVTLNGNKFTTTGNGISVDTDNNTNIAAHSNDFSKTGIGVKNNSSSLVDATNNFWGGSNGPTDTTADASQPSVNPTGTGAGVLGAVKYSPYCSSADCSQSTTSDYVQNGRTGATYDSLQAAIDNNDTQAGDTLKLTKDVTISDQVSVNKKVTIDGQGHTVSVSGAGYRFLITAADSTIKNLNITKTDKAGVQNIVGIQAANVTIDTDNFLGQYTSGDGDVSRALEISGNTNGFVIKNSSFKNLRQPAYINEASGSFTGNTVSGTKGLVVVGSSNVSVKGNTFTGNSTDIAIVDDDGNAATPAVNNYPCTVISQIKRDNGNPSVDNQVATTTCNFVAPTLTVTTPTENGAVSTAANGNKLKITGTFTDDKKANYAQFQLVKNGNSVALGTLYGYGSFPNPAAQYANQDGSYTYNLSVPADLASGDYSLFYTGTDFDGNVTSRMERKFTVDNTKPTVAITSPSANEVLSVKDNQNKLTIEGTASDQNFSYYYCYVSVTGGREVGTRGPKCQTAWAAGTPSKTAFAEGAQGTTDSTLGAVDLSGVADGKYTVHVVAKDKAGNTTEATQNFVLDNTDPTFELLKPTPGKIVSGMSTIQVKFNDANGIPTDVYPILNAVDKNGTTVGETSYNSILANATNGAIGITASGAFEGATVSYDSSTATYTISYDSKKFEDGTYSLYSVTNDTALNTATKTFDNVLIIDNTAPVAKITAPTAGESLKGTVTIKGTVTDNNPDHYYLVVKDANGKVVAGPGTVNKTQVQDYNFDTTKVADGTYTIVLQARDKAGNKSAVSTDTISVTVKNATTTPTTAQSPVITYGGVKNGRTIYGTVTNPQPGNVSFFVLRFTNVANNETTNLDNQAQNIAISNNGDGTYTWSYDVPSGLVSDGNYTVSLRAHNTAVNGNDSNELNNQPAVLNTNTNGGGNNGGGNTTGGNGPASNPNTNPNGNGATVPVPSSQNRSVAQSTTQSRSFVATTNPNSTDGIGTETTPSQTTTPEVLGATNKPSDTLKDSGEIKGDSTTTNGFAWYWWVLIVLAVLAALWWLFAAVRRRRQDAQDV